MELTFAAAKRTFRASQSAFSRGRQKNHGTRAFRPTEVFFVAVLSLETAKRSPFFALVFYVHETVQGMTPTPLFFC